MTSTPFCDDCPDHEACATGYPCDFVKRIDARAKKGREIRDQQIRGGMTIPDDEGYMDQVRREAAERALEQAEARVDQLTDTLALRSQALNATGADNDRMRAQIAGVSRIVGMLATEVELECDPDGGGICHGHDLTDDGRCALLSDLERVRAIIRGGPQ